MSNLNAQRRNLLEGLASNPVLRYAFIISADIAATAVSFALAVLVRFDFHSRFFPKNWLFALPCVCAVRMALLLLGGLHRWSFRMSGIQEAARLGLVCGAGTICSFAMFRLVPRVALPSAVLVLDSFMVAAFLASYRFAPRLATIWFADRYRSQREDSERTIIVGAGIAGDMLRRELMRKDGHNYQVVGFVDDDIRKIGTSIGGKPVFGKIDQLPEFVVRHRVSKVLIAIPRLPAKRVREILALSAALNVSFKIIPASFTYLDERVSLAMLNDLSPEDLLPRDAVQFDHDEIRSLVGGRRILVTGAAGSIGSEIARQVAAHDPAQLVLVDMNENELYFLGRRLEEQYPHLNLETLIADIRDADRIEAIGSRYRPTEIFHAAAHKHVPLMEKNPEEAIKNNVFGTLNVARMADRCGVEKFVLISTDKAVCPSSVMGVSKRVAELVVRDFAGRSKTKFTAVRFGNVLGSAGSVVPLFKAQIERGGPVTVTHADCTRYFMTIPEAVGLVLLAGLGGYGELCTLDMGEAIRIADLATHMITMAGLVPNTDIKVVFTGLRPGEKLKEELLTEAEEQSCIVRNKIFVAQSPSPPKDLEAQLAALLAAANTGNRQDICRAFQCIVPTFTPDIRSQPATRRLQSVISPTQATASNVEN